MGNVVVGVADMKLSKKCEDIIVTHALGSCLGIVVYDDLVKVAGMLHVMLPNSEIKTSAMDEKNPYMFVDIGVPMLFKQAYSMGAEKKRMKVYVAGGAGEDKIFAIGKRNYMFLRKLLWKNGVRITAEEVGGTIARNMYVETASGKVWIQSNRVDKVMSL